MKNITMTINSLNVQYVKEKVEKFNAKAIKLGKKEIKATYSEEYIDATDEKDIKELVDIEIEQFEDLIMGDYTLVAKIDHTYPIKNFVKPYGMAITEEQEHAWETAEGYCGHCNSKRKRNFTFMLQNNENLEYIQVGKSCLKDFTGHDIERTLNYFDLLEELELDVFNYNGKSKKVDFFKTTEVLGMVLNEVAKNGYSSAKQKYERGIPTTGDNVKNAINFIYSDIDERKRRLPSVNGKTLDDVEEAIKYIMNFNAKGERLEGFYISLQSILKHDYCKLNDVAILATLFVVCDIIKANEVKKQQKTISQHVGSVGDRIEVALTVKGVFGYDTDYGYMYISLFEDTMGNVYKWKSSNTLNMEKGEYKIVKATIKAHEEYGDEKQTVILRCKMI